MTKLQEFNEITLTDSYNKLSYKNDINNHIISVLDIALENTESEILKAQDFKFSKRLYWECISIIYENNPIIRTEEEKENDRVIEQNLYRQVINKLDTFFDKNDQVLLETMDFTISNFIDNRHYSDKLSINPWNFTDKIFIENNLLYSFTDNRDEYDHLLKNKRKESELSRYATIGVLGKGHRKDYAQSYIKDIYALRTLFLNLLDENNYDSRKPIKINEIFKQFRDLGILKTDLSDSNIRYWIVKPLKDSIKIGSNKNGFFIIRNEEDLNESYKSHYRNFIGFYKTLEKHKRKSSQEFENSDTNLNKHNDFLDILR
ncbi:hypothetical protein J3D55_001698 [Chryseobacterium ginsenosidimutans]|uniref:hypothetical protein n=1 Tax=Chryseobacterium ginsenosidimutans TaxID=687846 RepID=UPI0021683141|nr:hypothetical protein [Chryseobacterium ginsenosidimutans]MCS3868782.1 hypothetical protein [Chryseobacterium ginsenosidimutans]